MPADMTALAADLAAESAVTRALVAGLDEAGWDTPTPAAGWDIGDQISHLAYFDEVTVQSAADPAGFTAALAAAGNTVDPDDDRRPVPRPCPAPNCSPGSTPPAPACWTRSRTSTPGPGCPGSARP